MQSLPALVLFDSTQRLLGARSVGFYSISAAFLQTAGAPPSRRFGAAPDAVASGPVGWHVFARPVAFAERGAAPSALFACRCSFSWWLVGVLCPAAAGVSGDPGFAWQLAGPAGADISCRLRHCPCSVP